LDFIPGTVHTNFQFYAQPFTGRKPLSSTMTSIGLLPPAIFGTASLL
jgi:hypothetical protein